MSFVSGLNWNKCFSAFTLSKVMLCQRWGTMPVADPRADARWRSQPCQTPHMTSDLRTWAAQTLCSGVSVSVSSQTGTKAHGPFRTDLGSDVFYYSLVGWNCKIKLDGVADNSVKWIFVSICLFLNIPPTHRILHLRDSSVRCFQPFCSHILSFFSPSPVGDSLE